jgi:hypothetical protein
MLDLMEKHPGAFESSLLALFQNVARERPEVLRGNRWLFYEAQLGPTLAAHPANATSACSVRSPRAMLTLSGGGSR